MTKLSYSLFTMLFCFVISLPSWARTYKLGVVSSGWPGYSAVQVAKNKGFWKNQGVDVELILYSRISDYINAIINRRAELCFMPLPSLVDFRKEGNELIYLGTTLVSKPGDSIVVVKKALVKQSLKGQFFGIPGNESFGKTIAANYLQKVNNKLSDVQLVYMSAEDLSKNFINGRLKAIYTYGPTVEKTILAGDGVLVDAASTQFGLAAYKDILAGIPEQDLKKINRGIMLANQWINKPRNWPEYQRLLNDDFFIGLGKLDTLELKQMLDKLDFIEPDEVIHHNNNTLPILFNEVRRIFAHEGSLKGEVLRKFTVQEAIFNKALLDSARELDKRAN